MRRGMRKPHGLKVRRYAAILIDLSEYLASLPGATLSENFSVTEFDNPTMNSSFNSISIISEI